MQTIESLKRRIKSAQDLHAVVKTMKALAAVSIRQYETAVESLAEYNRTIEMGFQIILRQRPTRIRMAKFVLNERLGAIVFGSDQGMVGQFNDVIAQYAAREMDNHQVRRENRTVLAVGLRVFARLEEAAQPVEGPVSMPDSAAGITPVVQDMVLKIEAWRSKREILIRSSFFTTGHCRTPPIAPIPCIFCRWTWSGCKSWNTNPGPAAPCHSSPWIGTGSFRC